jgi:hypothetical protein
VGKIQAPLTGPKYSAKPLETMLQQVLGETWLSDTTGPEMLVPRYCIQAPAPVAIDVGGVMSSQLPHTFTGARPGRRPEDQVF